MVPFTCTCTNIDVYPKHPCPSSSQTPIQNKNHIVSFSSGVPETAVAMLAKDGERVQFHALFHITGAVETWLTRCVCLYRCSGYR